MCQAENIHLYSERSEGVFQWKVSLQVSNMGRIKFCYDYSENHTGNGLKRAFMNSEEAEKKLLTIV